MEIITVKNLSFTYPDGKRKALNSINLSINEGEMFLICGTSGCGKSTLLRHFKPCLTPHGKREGEVFFGGKEISALDKRQQAQRIGFVLQHPDDQIVTDKVWHELAFGCESLGMEQDLMRLRIGEMASYFGIQNWFYKSVNELSGGQKQLLNLASVMAMNPDVLILDEPTSQLDPIAAAEFLATLCKLNRELGITVIFTEHRLEEAFSMADRVLVMDKGGSLMCDTPSKVAEILDENSDIFYALPSSVALHRGLGLTKQSCPLTVKDSRRELLSLDLKKATLKTEDFVYSRGEEVLKLSECWFRYEKNGEDILRGLSMSAYSGEIFSIVGGNGTGKSTALSVISGINRVYRGKIKVYGKLQKQVNAHELKIAALTQDPRTLFVKDTVEADLTEMLRSIKDEEERSTRIRSVAELMNITELLKKHSYDLSGGEQQRVAMAKVLLTQPKILLLDEPTKGMDAHFKVRFGELLRRLASEGMAIVMVSHDIEFCAEYSHRCGLFFDGSIIAENTPRKFFSENHFYTTAASRIGRFVFENAVLTKELLKLCREQLNGHEG